VSSSDEFIIVIRSNLSVELKVGMQFWMVNDVLEVYPAEDY